MEGRKKMEEFYRKLKVGMKLKYAFTTVIVTFAVAMVVSLVSIVMMNVDTYKFYKEAYANSTLQMEIRKDIQLVGKYILWSMTTDDTGSTQSYLNSAQKYADQVGKNVTTLEKSYNDKKKVAELKDAIEELKKQRVALMELAQQNKNDEALALFNSDYNDATEKLQDILVDIGKVASAEAKSQYTSARVTGIVSIILMILIGTGAVAFSTVIRTTITGIMLKPIQELEGAAEKLKAGQLDVEINYESPDELGKLAGNFRQACKTLEVIVQDTSYLLGEMAEGNFNVSSNNAQIYIGNFRQQYESISKLKHELTLSATVSFMPVWENACFRMSITSSSVSTSGLIRKLSSIAPLVQSRCVRSFRVSCFIWCSNIFCSCCARRSLASPLASSQLSFSSFSFITAALLLGEQRVNAVRFSHAPAHPQD